MEKTAPKNLTPDDVTSAYRRMAVHPAVTSGRITGTADSGQQNAWNIRTVWSQRDIDRKEKTTFTKTYAVRQNGSGTGWSCIGSTVPQEISNILWDVESPSEKKRAVVLKKKDKNGDDKQFVEIWTAKQKLKTINVKALEKHGDIVQNDGQFGSLQWSACENYLLYVAEKKKPKTASFFDTKPLKDEDKDKGDNTDVTIKGGEYLYRESWGEQLVERHRTVICRLDVNNSDIVVLTQVPDHVSPGQALWGPNNDVVFAGWSHEPFRLGLRFCVERRSFVFKASFDGGECEQLSEDGRAVRCPSISPDLSRLVYLDTPEGGPHNQCSRLVMIDLKKWAAAETKEEARQVVVDVVNSPYKQGFDADKEEFPGLYSWADMGTLRNWLDDNVHFFMPSYSRSLSRIIMVNTDTKDVRFLYPHDKYPFRELRVPPANRLVYYQDKPVPPAAPGVNDGYAWSCNLLDVRGKEVLLSCSWPDQPPAVVFGHLTPGGEAESTWIKLDCEEEEEPVRKCFDWQVFVLDPKTAHAAHPEYDYLDFEAILYLPARDGKDDAKPPLVLYPHGGPHSAFGCSFALEPAVFASCGFAVLCVNYRGTLGFGQDNINSLLGHVGDFDVKDCMLALQTIQSKQLVDVSNSFVYGGSHGGFLSAHLIGQYPDQFKAASMRNPVINLTAMAGTTDIPDWVFTEAGLHFDYTSLAKGDLLTTLWNASPASHVDRVKTPAMLNIGLKDLRVPPSQGLEYYKMLKARNVPVECHTYPDSNHSLAEVEVEADCLVNSILWFAKHISFD